MLPPTKWPEELCFRVVCPYVHPSVRMYVPPSVHTYIHWYLKNCEVVLRQTWYEGISWGDNTFFGFQGNRVKGQIILWKKYIILHTMRHGHVTWYENKTIQVYSLLSNIYGNMVFGGHEVLGQCSWRSLDFFLIRIYSYQFQSCYAGTSYQ